MPKNSQKVVVPKIKLILGTYLVLWYCFFKFLNPGCTSRKIILVNILVSSKQLIEHSKQYNIANSFSTPKLQVLWLEYKYVVRIQVRRLRAAAFNYFFNWQSLPI